MKFMLSLWTVCLCLICLCHSMDRHRNKICYKAMTCIHTGREKCGVNGKGSPRRFFDSCDLLEYNCLKGTNYAKAPMEKCSHLSPIDDKQPRAEDENQVISHESALTKEGGIEGVININSAGDIDGEIELSDSVINRDYTDDDDVNKIAGGSEAKDHGEKGPVVEGNIKVDDDGGIEGTMEIDDYILDNVDEAEEEASNDDGDEDYGKEEVESDNEDMLGQNSNKGVEGRIEIDDDGNVEASVGFIDNAEKNVEVEIEIDDDEIEGRVESAASE